MDSFVKKTSRLVKSLPLVGWKELLVHACCQCLCGAVYKVCVTSESASVPGLVKGWAWAALRQGLRGVRYDMIRYDTIRYMRHIQYIYSMPIVVDTIRSDGHTLGICQLQMSTGHSTRDMT